MRVTRGTIVRGNVTNRPAVVLKTYTNGIIFAFNANHGKGVFYIAMCNHTVVEV